MLESSFDSFPCFIPMVARMEHCIELAFGGEHSYYPGQSRHRCCAELVVADAIRKHRNEVNIITGQDTRSDSY